MENTVYLIDGTGLCYRSFYALKLSTREGFPTGAIYGFYQSIRKIISEHNPEYMGVCFDVSRDTFRKKKFQNYKIQRKPTPAPLTLQFPLIRELVSYLSIPIIERENFEADDLIASLVKFILNNDMQVVVVSTDKDMYQLLDKDRVSIYNPVKDKFITRQDFEKEFGFSPHFCIDYFALLGDISDNIPGAKGIGKETARKLIIKYGNIESIFSHLDELSPKIKNTLLKEHSNILLSKDLVTLSCIDTDTTLKELRRDKPDYEKLAILFRKLEFKNFLGDIPQDNFSLTASLSIKKDLPEIKEGEVSIYLGERGAYLYCQENIYEVEIEKIFKIIQQPKIVKIFYDLKEQMSLLKDINFRDLFYEQTIKMRCFFDIKIAAYLLNSSLVDYSFENIVFSFLNRHISNLSPSEYPSLIYELYKKMFLEIKENHLEEIFFNVEMPLLFVLYYIQKSGLKVDVEALQKLSAQVEEKIEEEKKEIFALAGEVFNINSHKVLASILFDKLKIPPLKKTKTGYSTNEEVLKQLSLKYKIASHIINYRHLTKMHNTYISPFLEEVSRQCGWVHSVFNQTATETGRLSSSSPNLQNIPARGELSSAFRKIFISSFGKEGVILSADYSQIELRILAHFSGDDTLKKAFFNGVDIHTLTASLLFNVDESEVSPSQRDTAKRINFAILYGMTSYGLSEELKISPQEAEMIIQDYFLRYPKVKQYIEKVLKDARSKGYVSTILGRRRYLPQINSDNPRLSEFARRQAINTPIQGSCADIIKKAMVEIFRELKENNLSARMIIQIHDELIFDLPQYEIITAVKIIKKNMEEAIKLDVPLKVNIKLGENLSQIKEVDLKEICGVN